MNWKIKITCSILLLFFACKSDDSISKEVQSYLIELEELQSISSTQNIKLIDFRKPELYKEGHISGAINIWRTDIEDTSYPYRGMMANKESLEKLFSSIGITNDDLLIVYDDNGLCDAARFWWVLQNYNHTNIRLLNTRYSNWIASNGSISKEATKTSTSNFRFKENFNPQLYISKEDVLQRLSTNTVILDTRTPDEFSGKRQKKGAAKGGRISNSNLIDWSTAINFHSDKKLKSIQELDSIYSAIIPSKESPVIVYCHSGVRSAHTTFVLTQLLGYKNVKNYDGSWTEWSNFALPFERDSITSKFD